MKNKMITEKDVKALKKGTSKSFVTTVWIVFPLIITLSLVVVAMNLWCANVLARVNELSLIDLFTFSTQGFELDKTYTGSFCEAIERLYSSVIYLIMIIFFAIIWPLKINEIKRSKRILNYMKSNGCEPVDTANASNAASVNLNQSARIR